MKYREFIDLRKALPDKRQREGIYFNKESLSC